MVLILNGNSEIGADVWIDLGYLICPRHLFKLRAVTDMKYFFSEETYCAQHVLRYHLMRTMRVVELADSLLQAVALTMYWSGLIYINPGIGGGRRGVHWFFFVDLPCLSIRETIPSCASLYIGGV